MTSIKYFNRMTSDGPCDLKDSIYRLKCAKDATKFIVLCFMQGLMIFDRKIPKLRSKREKFAFRAF